MSSNSPWWWALIIAILAAVFTYAWRDQNQRKSLQQNGMAGTATVLSAVQTSSWVANNPVMEMTLEVQIDGQPKYTVQSLEAIPVSASARIYQGSVLRVRVDPKDPQKFVFDEPWAQVN